ncbi:PAS domain S-box-containing protein [Variovorax sp. YR750]|uniref:PAS domain-containing sensor histidine kinase n=1 Tax=unclassified Variovorax TaxID=663243 RepID=UPI0008C3DF98|nr:MULTISPECIES: PAS domain-containing sensor histidine kinase [unclassified Variovorax]SEM55334.1 PAS domain S-box-containing protein [Variovorax sp. YR750]SOD30658.1 PAS domain S-box-containing protein [Variovorax sp. YR752]
MSDSLIDPSPNVPFQAMIEQSLAGIYVLQDERFVYSNKTWANMIGYTPEELVNMTLKQLCAPDVYERVREGYYRRLNGEIHSMRFLSRGVHRDGHIVHIEIHGSFMIYQGRPAVGGVGIDMSERVEQDEALRRSREQLQELLAYTSRKLEDQRLSFARDVHDELGGMLTALKMDATRILRRVDTDELRDMTLNVLDLAQKTIENVKAISESLRPSALDHVGLGPAITRDLEQFSERSGVIHSLRCEAISLRLPPKRANAVYRIFQEGLTNVARHANARFVKVSLSQQSEWLEMELCDDGRGFVPAMQDRRSLGLLSMTERAREVGGQLDIISSPGNGARLLLRVPLL